MENNNNYQKKFRSPFFALLSTLALFLVGTFNFLGFLDVMLCFLFIVLALFFGYKSVNMQRKSDKIVGILCLALTLFFIILNILFFQGIEPDRDRARSAAIRANLSQFRSLAEMVKSIDGNYDNVCNESVGSYLTERTEIMNNIRQMNGAVTCNNSASSYCISATLPSSPGTWCVDSMLHSTSSFCGSAIECQ